MTSTLGSHFWNSFTQLGRVASGAVTRNGPFTFLERRCAIRAITYIVGTTVERAKELEGEFEGNGGGGRGGSSLGVRTLPASTYAIYHLIKTISNIRKKSNLVFRGGAGGVDSHDHATRRKISFCGAASRAVKERPAC